MGKTKFKVGSGFDVHKLVKERDLVLGGVTIPFEFGLKGHSDADVLLHSICDAVLGAIGAGDIGEHFPDNDPEYEDISSLVLLEKCAKMLLQQGYEISNLDCTIFAQEPKLSSYKSQMAQNIAKVFNVSPNYINIKATTTEELGFFGRKEGIGAHSTILIQSI